MNSRSDTPKECQQEYLPKPRAQWRSIGWVSLIFALWLAGSFMDITRYLPHFRIVCILVGMGCISTIIPGLRRALRKSNQNRSGDGWLVALWVSLATVYAIAFPVIERRPSRNDSDDALIVACTRLLHHEFPYYGHTFLGNPITPMPGALFFALPFQLLGRVSLQNLFWLGIFIWFAATWFRFRSTALAFLLVTVGNLHTLVNILDGADYPINWMYVCISTVLFLNMAELGWGWKSVASGIFLGIAFSSRPTYVLVFAPLALAYLVQKVGAHRALQRIAFPLVVMAAITAPFYLHDPRGFSPLHVTDRLSFLPGSIQRPMIVLLVILALGTALTGFMVRLNLPRLFLLAGVASAFYLVIPGIVSIVMLHCSFSSLLLLSYSDATACFVFLWAFRSIEDQLAAPNGDFGATQTGKDAIQPVCQERL
jgi:hypothetical protein